jgi:hypothetical protein
MAMGSKLPRRTRIKEVALTYRDHQTITRHDLNTLLARRSVSYPTHGLDACAQPDLLLRSGRTEQERRAELWALVMGLPSMH